MIKQGPDKQRRRRAAAGCCLLFFLFAGRARALGTGKPLAEYGHQSWQSDSGLPQNTVHAVLQTRDGYLWIGTEGGLVRFDGVEFLVFDRSNTPALRSDVITALREDAEGTLSIATPAGSVSERRDTFRPGASNQGSAEGAANGVAGSSALALALEASRRKGVEEILSRPGAAVSPEDVTSSAVDGAGSTWIGTRKGLAMVTGGRLAYRPEFAGMRVENLFADRQGALWVATTNRLARVAAGKVDFAPDAWSLAGVLSIYEDREGSMWFGTESSGLHVVREQAFSTLSTAEGLSASLVRAVFEDHTGTIWLGTSGGGLDRVLPAQGRPGRVEAYRGGLPSRVVLALAETRKGTASDLWVGTPEGLVRIEGGVSRVLTTADGLADDFVRSLYADTDGSLWVGTRNGLTHMVQGRFVSYSRLDGLGSDLVGAIVRSRDGTLWVGTLGGLSRMEGDRFVDGLPAGAQQRASGAVTALLEGADGALWIGTQESGLGRLKADRLTVYPATGTGLPRTIYGMLEDGAGNLWLSSRTGVDRVSVAALDAFAPSSKSGLPVAHYGAADGMRISEGSGGGHPAAWRARDGSLWFATLNGVSVVHPQEALRNTVAPLVAIEQVSVSDRAVAPQAYGSEQAAIRVAPGQGRITVQYAGLSFVAPQKVRYRYRLEGFDPGWVDAGARRTAYYTNVPPGKYRFVVMAANNDGVWSVTPGEVRFAVEPYVYQTWWFYAGLACLLGGLGFAAYRWRVHAVEALVGAQYRAVLEERGRIAREIHDTLAQGYVAVSVQLELVERLLQHSADAARGQLRQTRELVREGLEEARSSIWNLRAQADAETLPALLAAHVSSLTRRRGAQQAEPVLKFAVHGAYRPLARAVEDEVRRIAQEAIANAMAHAHARWVTVTLSYGTQLLELQVADDGVGLAAAGEPGRGHFGLQGMRERAAKIGAVLEIRSGNGTAAVSTAAALSNDPTPPSGTVVRLQLDTPAVRPATRKDRW